MKKKLGIGLALVACLAILTGCGQKNNNGGNNQTNNEPQEAPKVNTQEEVIKDREIEGFKFEKTSLVYQNGDSTLTTRITNTSSETKELIQFNIHVKDAEGNEITTLLGYVGGTIGANRSIDVSSSVSGDITNAASIEYELVK